MKNENVLKSKPTLLIPPCPLPPSLRRRCLLLHFSLEVLLGPHEAGLDRLAGRDLLKLCLKLLDLRMTMEARMLRVNKEGYLYLKSSIIH